MLAAATLAAAGGGRTGLFAEGGSAAQDGGPDAASAGREAGQEAGQETGGDAGLGTLRLVAGGLVWSFLTGL